MLDRLDSQKLNSDDERSVSGTVDFYNQNADAFVADTVNVDMGALYVRFLQDIPAGGLRLDAGCGSGRDSNAFGARGGGEPKNRAQVKTLKCGAASRFQYLAGKSHGR